MRTASGMFSKSPFILLSNIDNHRVVALPFLGRAGR
jgi:hypothetical protein